MAHYQNNGNNGKKFQRRYPTSRNLYRFGNKCIFRAKTENCDKSQNKATADYHAKRLKQNDHLREDDQDRAEPPALR